MKNVFYRPLSRMELSYAVVVVGLVMWLFSPRGHGSYRNRDRARCQSNLKQIGLAFAQYTQDYDERFPPVATDGGDGWAASIQPYLKSWAIFQCAAVRDGNASQLTDYFFNAHLSSREDRTVRAPASTILAGDGIDDSLPNSTLFALPPQWIREENSPAQRHLAMGNYLFADGHVKALKPAIFAARSRDAGRFHFEIK